MKIERIAMEGIASFRGRVEIDFRKEPLRSSGIFVISGPTGSGKSTVLDAITLALYHRTPRLDGRGDRNPENVVNMNRGAGRVEVDFVVGGESYRAVYHLKRGKEKKAALIKLPEGRVIADKARDVEKEVQRITGMEFESFRRAAILPQGEFTAFLKADPDRKREILEATVGMDVYERIKELYNEKRRELERELEVLSADLEAMKKEMKEEQPEFVERRVREVKQEIEQLEDHYKKLKERLEDLRRVRKLQEELAHIREGMEKLLKEEKEIESLQGRVRRIEKSVRALGEDYGRLLSRREEYGRLERRLKELMKKLEEREGKHRRHLEEWKRRERELQKEREELQKSLERARWLDALLLPLERYRRAVEEIKGLKQKESELKNREEAAGRELHELEETLKRLYRSHRAALLSMETEVKRMGERLKEEERRLEEARRRSFVSEIRKGLSEGDTCPVCGGIFKSEKAPEVEEAMGTGAMEDAVERIKGELEKKKVTLERARGVMKLFPEEVRVEGGGEPRQVDQDTVVKHLRRVENLKTSIESTRRERMDVGERRASLEEDLKGALEVLRRAGVESPEMLFSEAEGLKDRMKRLQDRESEIREEFERIAREKWEGEQELERIRGEVKEREEEKEDLLRKLSEMEDSFKKRLTEFGYETEESFREDREEARNLDAMRERIREYRESIEHLRRREEEINKELGGRSVSEEELRGVEEEFYAVESKLKELKRDEGALEERLKELKKREERLKESEEKLKALSGRLELYRKLGSVLERNRLRDYALEMVLAYLLETANNYLETLSEGRYLFSSEEGRILSSLKIVDMWSGGEKRPVETLSGGEQFLASLSLALALSDLNTTRGEVGSFFLDEGFGTLDSRSLEMVLEALERLRSEGKMIGVISHLEEVKRRIPVRILVRKSPGGSTVQVHPTTPPRGVLSPR